MNLKELYQEIILEHGKNPKNLGKFENFNKDAKGNNPLCGDKVHIYLKTDENNSNTKSPFRRCLIFSYALLNIFRQPYLARPPVPPRSGEGRPPARCGRREAPGILAGPLRAGGRLRP